MKNSFEMMKKVWLLVTPSAIKTLNTNLSESKISIWHDWFIEDMKEINEMIWINFLLKQINSSIVSMLIYEMKDHFEYLQQYKG